MTVTVQLVEIPQFIINTQDSEGEEYDNESGTNNISPTPHTQWIGQITIEKVFEYPVIPHPPVVNCQHSISGCYVRTYICRVKFMEAYLATIPLLPIFQYSCSPETMERDEGFSQHTCI